MSDNRLTLYKLILLFMLDRVDFPLTTSQLSQFILDKGYTDYFSFQQALNELEEAGFICSERIRSNTQFHLTPEGKEALDLLNTRYPPLSKMMSMRTLRRKKSTCGVKSRSLPPTILPNGMNISYNVPS